MPVQISCSHCSQVVRVNEEALGKKIRCPKCQAVFEARTETSIAPESARTGRREESARDDSRVRSQGVRSARPRTDDSRPQRPRPERGLSPWLKFGLPAGLTVLALSVVLVIWLLTRDTSANNGQANANEPEPLPPLAPDPVLADMKRVDLRASDLAYDPYRGHLLVAVSDKSAQQPNTLTALDPATGATVWTAKTGKKPAVLALSENGKAAWVGLHSEPSFQRIDVVKRQAGPLFPIKEGNAFGAGLPERILVLRGKTDSVVISSYIPHLSPSHQAIVVYDNGVPRPKRAGRDAGKTIANRLTFSSDPNVLYGYNNNNTGSQLTRLTIGADGIEEASTRWEGLAQWSADLGYGGGRVYGTKGEVIDAATGETVRQLHVEDKAIESTGVSVAVDSKNHRVYFLITTHWGKYGNDEDDWYGKAFRIAAYDTESLTIDSIYDLKQSEFLVRGGSLTVLGGTALAFRTKEQVVLVPTKNWQKL
jgi:hypothetical protein